MKKIFLLITLALVLYSCGETPVATDFKPATTNSLRAPSYPLITIDPYTCAWSFGDKLNEDTVRHWTGKPHPIIGALSVDGKTYRFMGGDDKTYTEKAVQKSVVMMPTQIFYTFDCGAVLLELIFTSPLLMDNLDLLSTPVNYITYQIKSTDEKKHDVRIFFDASDLWAMDRAGEEMTSESGETEKITFAKVGTKAQNILGKKGDDVRINWGYFYLAAAKSKNNTLENDENNHLKFSENLGKAKSASGRLMIGYDDIKCVQYFGENCEAYWKRNGMTIVEAFEKADADYISVMNRCADFDSQLMKTAEAAGGKQYAELCALTYRQAIAAHKLFLDKSGELHFMSKENFSNGSIGTVDVTYPSMPLFLLYNTELAKGLLNHIFYYSESGKWEHPFAAHDVGTYPLANGQTYGEGMPVEESGNMLILTTAITQIEGNADYAAKHWETLTIWANYLTEKGLDPENQLCTDDFAGHLAHNANLSIKAILGIAGYGKMAAMLGKDDVAKKYLDTAREMAQKWEKMDAEGDHYKLTFDGKDTWSEKYNLVWDRLLDINIFSPEIAVKEMAYYRTKLNKFGLPLDSRKTYAKSDWIMWTACLTGNNDDFKALMQGVYNYCNESPVRVPLTDWHETTDGKPINMRARSVVGGYYMKLLERLMTSNN